MFSLAPMAGLNDWLRSVQTLWITCKRTFNEIFSVLTFSLMTNLLKPGGHRTLTCCAKADPLRRETVANSRYLWRPGGSWTINLDKSLVFCVVEGPDCATTLDACLRGFAFGIRLNAAELTLTLV